MRKVLALVVLMAAGTIVPFQRTEAQLPVVEIIKAGIKKVIKAVDLKIQRLQNKTIWLQNVQKVIENKMSELKLKEIANWVEKQRVLYKDYYDELWQVKNVISYYHKIKEISNKQVQLVEEYKRAWALFKQDKNFSPDELRYMGEVYNGILRESGKNLEQIFLVIRSSVTQMSDAKRLEIIDNAFNRVETNYTDLKDFNNENRLVSLRRAKSANDLNVVKELYGLQ
jgi:hypothetical protein